MSQPRIAGDGISPVATRSIVIRATDGRDLLTIDLVNGTVHGELEDAGAAAEAFVRYLRLQLTS